MKTATERPQESERRWIRLQEVGLSLLLAIPVSLIVLVLLFEGTTGDPVAPTAINIWIVLALVFGTAGAMLVKHGQDKRREIVNKERIE